MKYVILAALAVLNAVVLALGTNTGLKIRRATLILWSGIVKAFAVLVRIVAVADLAK